METVIKLLSIFILIICVFISFKNPTSKIKFHQRSSSSSLPANSFSSSSSSWDFDPSFFLSIEGEEEADAGTHCSLQYDFYRNSCPQAEEIVRLMVREFYKVQSCVAPALLRLAFHDCFIEGCDASILLDDDEGLESEKDSPPNQNMKGFNIIDVIKSQLEEVCSGIVSCADIVVLAARESVVQAGGPFYPLLTGRKDSTNSFPDKATSEIPSPDANLSQTLASFASRGFDERETVSLLGGHSIGMIHCKFFKSRLYNFSGTNKPDPSLDPQFCSQLRSICHNSHTSTTPAASPSFHASGSSSAPSTSIDSSESSSTASSTGFHGSPSPSSEKPGRKGSMSSASPPSLSFQGSMSSSPSSFTTPFVSYEGSLLSSHEEPGFQLAYEGPGVDFGPVYYRSLLQGRGILITDQQLMSGEDNGFWVRTYASNISLFHRDFAQAMMKLSNLHVLTGLAGQVRFNCSKVVR